MMNKDNYQRILDNEYKRVIEQDILRTRIGHPFFKSTEIQSVMKSTLLSFCFHYNLIYMQGINELLAVCLSFSDQYSNGSDYQESDSNDSDTVLVDDLNIISMNYMRKFALPLAIFERLIFTLHPVMFSNNTLDALQAQMASIHQLLFYFEPVISKHVLHAGFSTDMYLQPMLICLFCQRVSIEMAIYIWSILLKQKNSPSFILYFCLGLIKLNELPILSKTEDALAQILLRLNFSNEEEIDKATLYASYYFSNTPESVISDHLLGFDVSISDERRSVGFLNLSYRPCAFISYESVFSHATPFVILDLSETDSPLESLSIKMPKSITKEIIKFSSNQECNHEHTKHLSREAALFFEFLVCLKEKGKVWLELEVSLK